MASAAAAAQDRFIRRTTLNPEEYRVNFRQIDCEVIEVLTSSEADRVTSQMSKIYLRLVNASQHYWEREGVLRFAGEEREGEWQTAWEQLVLLAGVASATARKALAWMARQGIIGYFAGKNGVGIRIFINRAASSIRQRPGHPQKNLRPVQTSTDESHTSSAEAGFKESHADRDNLDLDLIPRAPEGGALDIPTDRKLLKSSSIAPDEPPIAIPATTLNSATIVEEIVRRVIPQVKSAAAHQQEQTREWFVTHALPKAIRVAQRSAYDVLRAHGTLIEPRPRGSNCAGNSSNDRRLGKYTEAETTRRRLRGEEMDELAESCIALLATQGQAIEHTLSEMSAEAGGFLLPDDAAAVRAKIQDLIPAKEVFQNNGR
jgi:hypothetical protein